MQNSKEIILNLLDRMMLIVVLLLVIMSIAAFTSIHLSLSKRDFLFTAEGLNYYLNSFDNYKALFTGSVATLAVYFGLLRLKAATDANDEKIKNDRFSDWKVVMDIRFLETEKYDPYMKREFIRLRFILFNHLYKTNFNIKNQQQLENIYQSTFKNVSSFLETNNKKYIDRGGVYPHDTFSYSFDSFRFLFLGGLEEYYSSIENDLLKLYLNDLSKIRIIDPSTYRLLFTQG